MKKKSVTPQGEAAVYAAILGALVEQLREAQGMTQTEAARQLGVSQSLLSKLELGARTAEAFLVLQLSQLLRVQVEDLEGWRRLATERACAAASAACGRTVEVEELASLPEVGGLCAFSVALTLLGGRRG